MNVSGRWKVMKYLILVTFFLAVCPPSASGVVPTIPADEIERGMVGFGLTVFQGTQIDTFQVKILGVMRNWAPKSDIIMARLDGGPLRETAVIAGMSGSPVYIDGGLIGAVAYGFPFSKEPICGITPIEEMIRTLDRGLEMGPEMGALLPPEIPEIPISPEIRATAGCGDVALVPLTSPLVLSGFDRRVVNRMAEELTRYGFAPVQGGAGTSEQSDAPLDPGAAVGVQFVQGDVSAASIGTMTYRDGDRVLAFGHPMFSSGPTDLPMTLAYIHDVLPSIMWSSKIGSPGRIVGAIRQDRRTALAGVLGEIPDMMPVSVRVDGEVYEFQVLRHRDLGSFFAGYGVFNAIMSTERQMGDATVYARALIELDGHPPVERENVYSGSAALFEGARGLVAPVSVLIQNRFEQVRIERVQIEIEVEERRRTASIEEVRVDRTRLRPGEHVRAKVLLRPYLDEPFEQEVALRIPPDLADRELILVVGDARSALMLEQNRAPGRYAPGDLRHLLQLLAYEERNDELIMALMSPDRGLTVQAQELPSLPLSMLTVLDRVEQERTMQSVSGHVLARRRVRTDYVLSGGRTLRLTVDRRAR